MYYGKEIPNEEQEIVEETPPTGTMKIPTSTHNYEQQLNYPMEAQSSKLLKLKGKGIASEPKVVKGKRDTSSLLLLSNSSWTETVLDSTSTTHKKSKKGHILPASKKIKRAKCYNLQGIGCKCN